MWNGYRVNACKTPETFSNLLVSQDSGKGNSFLQVSSLYHCFFIIEDFLSFVAISWNQERRNHSSQLLCQVSILLSSVFRCTFSWILGEEEWEMFNFQCSLLSTAWFSNTRYRRVCRKWLRFPGMTGTKSWLFQSVLNTMVIYLHLFWNQNGGIAASSSSCLLQWSLFVLPELLVFLGPEPQWAPNHHSGKYQLMCWLQILPLEQALPKTMLAFPRCTAQFLDELVEFLLLQ